MDPRHLRRPEEARRRADERSGVGGVRESVVPTSGPDWERHPVRPVVGVGVAVYGLCKARLCRLVADMMGRGEFVVVLDFREGGTSLCRPAYFRPPLLSLISAHEAFVTQIIVAALGLRPNLLLAQARAVPRQACDDVRHEPSERAASHAACHYPRLRTHPLRRALVVPSVCSVG